jgi:ADP-ribose pyrophosphatase YjhB (NUDIX family)
MTIKHHLASWLQRSALLRWMLSLGVQLLTPRHHIGAVGVIFNDAGQVLMVEHVFRPYHAWGLPGGWVNRGENPAQTIQREVKEELNLTIQVKKLLFCESQGGHGQTIAPLSLGLAYYCRQADERALPDIEQARSGYEVLSTRWVDPEQIEWRLLPLQQRAIILGKQEFDRE